MKTPYIYVTKPPPMSNPQMGAFAARITPINEKSPIPSNAIAVTSNHSASGSESTQGITTYLQHPLSAAFPAMSAEDYQNLKDSIEVNGVLNPITVFEDMVIDGWHRYCAANQLAIDCPTQALESWIDPKDFVLAQNKNRRHITLAQLIAATTAVYGWHPRHRPNKSAVTAHLTSGEVAEKTGTSVRNVERFREIERKATTEVMDSVLKGGVGLTKGAEIAKLPPKQQREAINKPLPKKAKKQKPEALAEEVAPAPTVDLDEYTELDALRDQISDLQAELAVKNMVSTVTEEQSQAAELITEFRKELKTAKATLDAVSSLRNILMMENAELRKQITRQRREIDRCMGTRTA
jgi:hypothetical protein